MMSRVRILVGRVHDRGGESKRSSEVDLVRSFRSGLTGRSGLGGRGPSA